MHYTHINRLTSRVNKWSGISIHRHLLRHYVATQATAHKASGIDIMHYLGHKNLRMTADYTRNTKESSLNVFVAITSKNNKNFKKSTGTK
ncbi:tyrosine-type recombinase/integrase [Lacticaseibacillus rhamnosus]|uniref:tyrosine-type recombinase/integrase n=1 Tax=Lacticaseibacillus rhamnosus TaxID=47715 RepID=UPI002286FA7A|nr:tyrosine-type recombinase/integrase [Lacticaseibacillus rhamnosus]